MEVLLNLFQFVCHFLVSIKWTLGRANHYQLVGKDKDRIQLLPLQFAEITIDPKLPHVLCIFLDLTDKIFIGSWRRMIMDDHVTTVLHQELFSHNPKLLNFAFQLSILGDE